MLHPRSCAVHATDTTSYLATFYCRTPLSNFFFFSSRRRHTRLQGDWGSDVCSSDLGAYKYPRELNWIVGVLLLALGMLEGFTGYLLPWDQTAYWATVVGININATAPFLGPFIGQFLQGGNAIGENTLSTFYSLHMLLIPGAIIGLIILHLHLVIRLGVSTNPWTKNAAGDEPLEPKPVGGREGLMRPGGRGGANGV